MIAKAAETDDTGLVRAQLDAVLPMFADDLRLDRDVLEQWADFDARIGLVKTRPTSATAFDFTCAVKCEAPERCHRPGCHRSILVAASRASGLQSRVWRAISPPAGHMN